MALGMVLISAGMIGMAAQFSCFWRQHPPMTNCGIFWPVSRAKGDRQKALTEYQKIPRSLNYMPMPRFRRQTDQAGRRFTARSRWSAGPSSKEKIRPLYLYLSRCEDIKDTAAAEKDGSEGTDSGSFGPALSSGALWKNGPFRKAFNHETGAGV